MAEFGALEAIVPTITTDCGSSMIAACEGVLRWDWLQAYDDLIKKVSQVVSIFTASPKQWNVLRQIQESQIKQAHPNAAINEEGKEIKEDEYANVILNFANVEGTEAKRVYQMIKRGMTCWSGILAMLQRIFILRKPLTVYDADEEEYTVGLDKEDYDNIADIIDVLGPILEYNTVV